MSIFCYSNVFCFRKEKKNPLIHEKINHHLAWLKCWWRPLGSMMNVSAISGALRFLADLIFCNGLDQRRTIILLALFFKYILQGLGVGPGSVTERWPFRKNARKSAFFRKKIKNYLKKSFLHIFSSYAKILGETNFHAREIPRSG